MLTADSALDFGMHKGKPMPEVPTDYLLYMLSRDSIRQSRPASMRIMLVELARRLHANFEDVHAGLSRSVFAGRKFSDILRAREAKKAAQRAKLTALDARRKAEREARRAEQQAHVERDAFWYVRQKAAIDDLL